MFFEAIVGFLDMYFSQGNVEVLGFKLEAVSSMLMTLLSMPIRFINRSFPFYAGDLWLCSLLTLINLSIQTFLIYGVLAFFKKKT